MKSALILGGVRSGKSAYAEALAARLGASPLYIATAQPFDDGMRARIKAHKARRGPHWRSIEAPLDIAPLLHESGPILVDCLTLWLSNLMHEDRDIEAQTDALLAALARAPGPVVMVSNEIGLGGVSPNALARRFADAQGRLNQRIAAAADKVVFIAAGLPLALKGEI